MNSRRNFLRCAPLAGAIAACPVIAVAATVASSAAVETVPMRGESASGAWSLLEYSTGGEIAPSKFVSHHMRQRPDGLYELIFEREAPDAVLAALKPGYLFPPSPLPKRTFWTD